MKLLRSILLFLLIVGSLANLGLSIYIQQQKTINTESAFASVNPCFVGDGGCATVQTSVFANTFGVSNPIYGIFVFTILAIVFALLLVSVWHHDLASLGRRARSAISLVLNGLMAGGVLFSVWLLFVQFFILKTTCIYCVWVDSIMIGMGLLYLIFKDILLD